MDVWRLLGRLKRKAIGTPERIPQRLLTVAIVLTLAVAVGGAVLAIRTGVETASTSSLPYLRPALELATSTWVYVALLAIIVRRILTRRDQQYAEQAADVTGYEPRSVRRLAYEAKSPDGSTRVIASTEDDPEAIEARIRAALDGAEDDTMSLNPEAFAVDETEPDEDLPVLVDAVDEERPSVLTRARRAPRWLLTRPLALARRLRSRSRDDVDEDDQDDGDDEELRDPWLEQYKLFRLDLASTLDFSRLLWQFAVPALLTIALLLIVVRFWVQPWLYPPLFAAGLLVGLANYGRLSWRRSRRLSALRQDRETVNWSDVSLLLKEVDLAETRVQYAWLGDRRYAHDDRDVFAEEIALRAYELVNGVEVSPSVMEKQARQLETMQPDLHGFRDEEKEQIMTWLLDRVGGAQHGLVPKAKLLEDCIEHDLAAHRWGPGKRGKGHDPELVREAYRELVPAALVEQEIALDEAGEETLTAVRHRADPLPPEYGQIRAQFSSQFSNYARWDPLYELPDVSDLLDEEPVYASTLGYRKP